MQIYSPEVTPKPENPNIDHSFDENVCGKSCLKFGQFKCKSLENHGLNLQNPLHPAGFSEL
jgi:hypothetical protein